VGKFINEYPHRGVGEVVTATAAGAAVTWLANEYGDDLEDAANDVKDWAKEQLKDGWQSFTSSIGFGPSKNRFKCKAPNSKVPYWTCYSPAFPAVPAFGVKAKPEELISCPRGYLPERTAILHPSPKKRITKGLTIGGRFCTKIGLPGDPGIGPCTGHEVDASGNKIIHRGFERTGIFHPSPKRRLVKKSKDGRVCMEVLKPTPGLIPDLPHKKSQARREYEQAQAAAGRAAQAEMQRVLDEAKAASKKAQLASTSAPAVVPFASTAAKTPTQSPATLIMIAAAVGAAVLLLKAK